MKQNKETPLEMLRLEKEQLRRECKESENRLSEHWNYMSNNVGSLILSSALAGIRHKLGFGSSKSELSESDNENATSSSHGVLKGLLGGLLTASPFLLEMVQPMVMSFVMKKFKSLFSKKKKKKKKSHDDDDDD